jgi:3-deoxy-D-manno-octulosonic-acid transferase
MIRYLCHVTDSSAGGSTYADLSFVYFEALWKTEIPIRVLPVNGMVSFGEHSRWAKYSGAFIRPMLDEYTNVVVGSCRDLVRLYTIGAKNVAITASWNNELSSADMRMLMFYDKIICSSEEEAGVLKAVGIEAGYAPPTPGALKEIL